MSPQAGTYGIFTEQIATAANGNQAAASVLGKTAWGRQHHLHHVEAIPTATVVSGTTAGIFNVVYGTTTVGTITIPSGTTADTPIGIVWGASYPIGTVVARNTAISVTVATRPVKSTNPSNAVCTFDVRVYLSELPG